MNLLVKNNLLFIYLFISRYTVPTLISFITIRITSITSQYQFQITMRLCHLLVIQGSTVKLVTRYFHFLRNLLGLKAMRGLDSNTPNHFILPKGKPFPMKSIWSPRAVQLSQWKGLNSNLGFLTKSSSFLFQMLTAVHLVNNADFFQKEIKQLKLVPGYMPGISYPLV